MATHDCQDCARSDAIWRSKGRCVEPLDGVESLPITWQDARGAAHTAAEAYPVAFDRCPRSLLREDLYPEETAVADVVAQAAYAEVKRRWPDVPARLWSLLTVHENTLNAKMEAAREARLSVI